MNVKIRRVDTSLPLPEYQTEGSVGFDVQIREDRIVKPHSLELLPTNVIIEVPKGYMLSMLPRSSTPKKKPGLIIPHSFGVIDQDYHGPEDEIGLLVYNVSDEPIEVKRGERLGQAIFVKIEKAQFEEVSEDIKSESRGGFGSTGS